MAPVIIKTGFGNVLSVYYALRRLGTESVITDDPMLIRSAERVVFPGVGDAGSVMKYLRESGLDQVIKELTCPVLGICLAMQLMCSYSEESDTECLGIFDQPVIRFEPRLKVPHVGWNKVKPLKGYLAGQKGEYFYFVHSFYARIGKFTTMTCDYISPFSAGIERNNFYGLQFHPEKSGKGGEAVLKRFLELPGGRDE